MESMMSLEEIKSVAFDTLKFFTTFCEKNDIKYFLAYGTLLGAVRHSGFIPWDDDIDVYMLREDYNRLIKIWKENNTAYYTLISMHNNKKFNAPLAKVFDNRTALIQNYSFRDTIPLGVYIDIFILDYVPENINDFNKMINTEKKLRKKWFRSLRKLKNPNENYILSIIKYCFCLPYRIRGYRYYLNRIDILNKSIKKSTFIGNLDFGDLDERNHIPLEYFEYGTKLFFEGTKFSVPKNFDDCLKLQYGDYMTLPPQKERISNHDYVAYWKK